MRHPVDILEQLVDYFQSQLLFEGTSITVNSDETYTLETCNTYYLQERFVVRIDGRNYEVVEVLENESVTLKGGVEPPLTFSMNPLYFFAGEVRETNIEMQISESDVNDRTPFVFVYDRFTEKRYGSESSVEMEFTVRMFWLTQCNFEDWKQSDHRNKAIKPMRSLIAEFVKYIDKTRNINRVEDFNVVDHHNFGIYQSEKGQKALYFNDFLSGSELIIKLSIMKNFECKC